MRSLLGGGHGTTIGQMIHETGVVVIINRRHAEYVGALLIKKMSFFVSIYVMYVVRKHL